jgi:hypothetical protein
LISKIFIKNQIIMEKGVGFTNEMRGSKSIGNTLHTLDRYLLATYHPNVERLLR